VLFVYSQLSIDKIPGCGEKGNILGRFEVSGMTSRHTAADKAGIT
jgi:hypothetical protein